MSPAFLLLIVLLIVASFVWIAIVALATPTVRYRLDRRMDVASAEFIQAMQSVLPASVTHENRIDPIHDGRRFYPAMLAAIAGAQRSIALECYIFHQDRTGDAFIAALAGRARAGVRVRVIFDRVGSRGLRDVNPLLDAGCEVAWHPRARWRRPHRLTNSTHREILVIDGRIAFTGGAGISDWWAMEKNGHPPWRDTMVRIEGPVVASLQAVFAENWLECRGDILSGEDWFPRLQPCGPATAFAVTNSPASLAGRALLQSLIECASREIRLATPYFVPDPSFLQALMTRARQGIRVIILLPGRRMDHPWVRLTSRRLFRPLLDAGVRLFEYQPAMLHGKLMVVDGRWSVVGTMNFDLMSFQYLDEVALAVVDEGIAAELCAQHDADLAESVELTARSWRRTLWERSLAGAIWMAAGQHWVRRLGDHRR